MEIKKTKETFNIKVHLFNPGILPHFLHKKPFILNVLNQKQGNSNNKHPKLMSFLVRFVAKD